MPVIRATYRLQLHAGFPLARARGLVPYLSRLGISHLHCSPLLRARTGSTHGYDVVDPTMLDPELGTEEELAALGAELAARGMGLVLDIVPNHMAASAENPAWEDVLAHGPASRYARWFDIDWRASERELRARVLLPVLGERRAVALERDEITLALEDGVPRVRYFEHGFPLDPRTLAPVLAAAAAVCDREIGAGHLPCAGLREVARALAAVPRRLVTDPPALARRRQESAAALERLRGLVASDGRFAEVLREAVTAYARGPSGRPRLRRLLDAQVYRLAHWRRAAREINYRRFFDVNDLVALHMEDPEVFGETHALVLEWRRRGWVDGFRVDHPDGLLDPLGYFERLAEAAFGGMAGPPPVYVEKILSPGERLPAEWPVAGTTGYDFLNEVEGLFLSPEGFAAIERTYHRVIRRPLEFAAAARLGKRRVLESALAANVRRLAERLHRLAGPDHPVRQVPIQALGRAIVETIASLPVYRTYVDGRRPVPAGEDRRRLEGALAGARARGRARSDALDLLEAALLAREGPMLAPGLERSRLRFVQRFQQLSGPAAAKGVEDTAFYVYTPLLSRNEVGGGPEAPLHRAAADFHAGNAWRAARFPRAMLALTTHDTKRTADVRARLDVLSEIPDEWAARLDHWRRLNLPYKTTVGGHRLPDPNTVQHLFQAAVGIWPLAPLAVGDLERLRARLGAYALKAAREAKERTSWTEPDPEFETALRSDLEALLAPDRAPRFHDDLERFVRAIGRPGLWNSAARTVLQLASPGVPDVYQGDELWAFALVDPDNRQSVDYDARARALEEVERGFDAPPDDRRRFLRSLIERPEDGRLKLHLIRSALQARRSQPQAFGSPAYFPLAAVGGAAERVVAFARGDGTHRLVAAVPRLLATRLMDGGAPTDPALWGGTRLPLPAGSPARWRCALSGEPLETDGDGALSVAALFGHLPGALLLAAPGH
ncbi:MAG TPA: malto-oligosyltrehalose synthase [Gemmatimonadales bacterium]|nr:malto-oligosyltrehalose synthase [Gemmatimonadales bacterium]